MQIIIPMSGFGERFRRAGYTVPKPMMIIEGKPVIAHIVDMFPGETNIIFVCAQAQLADPAYHMEAILREICPNGRIVGIPTHKLGPIHTVRHVEHLLDPEEPALINYCDFTCYWDWRHFKKFVRDTGCYGAIPSYRGFHPHALGNTSYAYIRETNGWVVDIQEKQPYTDNPMQEFASSGTYFFATARIMADAFRTVIDQGFSVGGEFYVSLAYKPLLAAGRAVAVYQLQHFMQWGTPEDVYEYNYWSSAFRRLIARPRGSCDTDGSVIVPMAGLGQRFLNEGYTETKPLIPVSGRSMVTQAAGDLPPASEHAFVLRIDMPGHGDVSDELQHVYPKSIIKTVDRATEGQACTALIGLEALEQEFGQSVDPVTIGSCDNGALYDLEAYRNLLARPEVDVIVWGARGYPNALRRPTMFGWIRAQGDLIQEISVKSALEDPKSDPIVLGTFTFRRAADFRCAVRRLIARGGTINGEYYIDSCINDAIELGLDCRLFEVDSYLCWGEPNDLRTFEYWQSCFHKWSGHPYRLELDRRVPESKVADLETKYQATHPELPRRRQ